LKRKKIFLILLFLYYTVVAVCLAEEKILDASIQKSASMLNLKQETLDFINYLSRQVQDVKTEYELAITELNRKNKDFETKIYALQNTIESVEKENANLKTVVSRMNILKNELSAITKERDILFGEINNLKGRGVEEIQLLNKKISDVVQAYSHSELELKKTKQALEDKNEKLQEQLKFNTDIQSMLKSSESKWNELTFESAQRKKNYSELLNDFTKLKEINQSLTIVNDTISAVNSLLRKENIYLLSQIVCNS